MLETLVWGFLLLVSVFDVYWMIRLVLCHIVARFKTKLSYDEESVCYGICWTTDIDYFLHMNNGKYFRELDFARFDWYFRTGFTKYIRSRTPRMYSVQHGASIRYRRSIDFLVPFKVVTKLVYWDERSVYFEQSFISLHDGFVRAVALCKNTFVNGSVKEMMRTLGYPEEPAEVSEEITLWIKSQEVSSNRLRMKGLGPSVGTALSALDKQVDKSEEIKVKDSPDTSETKNGWEVLDDQIQKSKED